MSDKSRLLPAIAVLSAIPLAIVFSMGGPAPAKDVWIPVKKPKLAATADVAAAPTAPTPAAPAAKPAEPPPEAPKPKPAPKSTAPEPPRPTPGVKVALTLAEPIADAKTVLWTAAFQTAWDELAERSGSGADNTLGLGTPAKPEDVQAMNAGRLPAETVEPGTVVTVVGAASEKAWKSIDKASKRPRPPEAPAPNDKDFLAYATLNKSVRFEVPFGRATEPLAFGGGKTPVHAYGLVADAPEADPVERRRRAQVLVHVPSSTPEAETARAAVVELKAAAGARVIVSGRAPKASLEETWKDVAAVLATPGVVPAAGSRLSIPRVALDARRDYPEFVPATVAGEDATLVFAHQDAVFTADERGAGAEPPTKADDPGGTKVDVVLDGPFLVAVLASGAERPYLLLWVGTDEVLSR